MGKRWKGGKLFPQPSERPRPVEIDTGITWSVGLARIDSGFVEVVWFYELPEGNSNLNMLGKDSRKTTINCYNIFIEMFITTTNGPFLYLPAKFEHFVFVS